MFAPAYLDHNATTPLDPRVLEAMLPYLGSRFGNASSRHEYGRHARQALDTARQQVAAALGAHATEVVFTSGGSEANNLFIKGAAAFLRPGLVALGATEHPSVREPARQMRRAGWRLEEMPVHDSGLVRTEGYTRLLQEKPTLISLMLANNETGVVQDVAARAAEAKAAGGRGWFHTDAVQALGKMALDFRALNAAGVHALTVSAHKIYGPLGAGALVLDKRVELAPLVAGGGQERNLRSGTENVPAIVGFGLAAELAVARLSDAVAGMLRQRREIEAGLANLGARIFGAAAERLPNTVFFGFEGIEGETLVGHMDRAGFALASGSACSSANPEPSHVLLAMGVAAEVARSAVRVSVSRDTKGEDVQRFVEALGAEVRRLRSLSAMAA
ncbi:MAG: cysteine desulfurase family protein [Rhodocyclaceae bacterium]|nr:cysteine desulfurase family protein [Rhodocyclaceae bacterium]